MKQDVAALAGIALLIGGVACFSRGVAAVVLGIILIAWAYVTSKKPSKPKTE